MGKKAILWDFDGTLAYREGLWSGCLAEVLQEWEPAAGITRDDVRPLLHNGFPWHAPDRAHPELSTPEAWWEVVEALLAQTARTLMSLRRAPHPFGSGRRGYFSGDPSLEASRLPFNRQEHEENGSGGRLHRFSGQSPHLDQAYDHGASREAFRQGTREKQEQRFDLERRPSKCEDRRNPMDHARGPHRGSLLPEPTFASGIATNQDATRGRLSFSEDLTLPVYSLKVIPTRLVFARGFKRNADLTGVGARGMPSVEHR